jgi:hypothetical protein
MSVPLLGPARSGCAMPLGIGGAVTGTKPGCVRGASEPGPANVLRPSLVGECVGGAPVVLAAVAASAMPGGAGGGDG